MSKINLVWKTFWEFQICRRFKMQNKNSIKLIWKLPVPSTNLTENSPKFQQRLGRTCALVCQYAERKMDVTLELMFEGVESYKATYYKSCTVEMIESAYGKVVDVGLTDWLDGIQQQLSRKHIDVTTLKHLRIYFDDGPCYEFICRDFHVEESRSNFEI